MEFESLDTPLPGHHLRMEVTNDMLFAQRSVPAVIVPGLGYAILTAFSPYQMGVNVWAVLALVILPATCGLFVHSIGDVVSLFRRARRGFTLSFVMFGIYALVSMGMIRTRMQGENSSVDFLFAIALSAGGYALVAGVVSAVAASLPARHHEGAGY